MKAAFLRLIIIAAIAANAIAVDASPKPIVVAALKGPSGIGMVKLFETPPVPSDGSSVLLVAVPAEFAATQA